jgi:hypothetical protein
VSGDGGGGMQLSAEDDELGGMGEMDDVFPKASGRRNGPVEELLVNDGQYINEVLLSKVLKEEEDLVRQVLTTPKYTMNSSDSSTSESATPLPSFSLLALSQSTPGSSAASRELHPEKWQAIQLWNVFVQNVDIMSKVLHIPSAQITIFTALNDLEQAPPDVSCLLFAVYFCATTSLTPDEVFNILGQRKTAAQDHFRTGLEMALIAANILDAPSLTALQALAMFLVSS